MLVKKENLSGITECLYDSSNIFRSIYYENDQILFLFFQRGGVYSYYPMNEEKYNEFETAESQGKYFTKNIRQDGTIQYKKMFKLTDIEKQLINEAVENLKKEIDGK
ncbi:MAG: KTSC domain-containing protein [bacterium]